MYTANARNPMPSFWIPAPLFTVAVPENVSPEAVALPVMLVITMLKIKMNRAPGLIVTEVPAGVNAAGDAG